MMTVLIILLAYPVANVVLNTLALGTMSYILRREEDFIQSFLYGPKTVKYTIYPFWIKAFGTTARLTVATVVCMVRGRWYL